MKSRELSVMTLNVYFGADLAPVFAARDFPHFIETVASLWEHVQATDIPARARSIAHEIAAAGPDLVGLQEIALWSTGMPGALSAKYDFLLLILEALEKEGVSYTPIAIRKELDETGPLDMNGHLVRFEDRHAVLMRVAPQSSAIRPYNIEAQQFAALYETASPIAGSVKTLRSWLTIDAMLDDRKFRLIETHIESLDEAVQVAQSRELIAALASTELPIIVIGDFNSNAHQQAGMPDATPTYPGLIAAGFQDAWAAVNRDDPGNTCCHAPDLRNIAAELDRRLDLVLTRGAISPISARLVAAEPSARSRSGVWPTDHAGVLATLRLE